MNLKSSVKELPFVGEVYTKRLNKLGVNNLDSLFQHIPSRYLDFRKTTKISDIIPGDIVTISGKILFIKNQFTKRGRFIQLAKISDGTGEILAIWFNQTYLVNNLRNVENIKLAGKVDYFANQIAFVSPEYEVGDSTESIHTGRLVPIYPETRGVSSKWLRARISFALPRLKEKIDEFLPEDLLNSYNLYSMQEALFKAHFPNTLEEAEKANRRLAFNELLFLHLQSFNKKLDWQKRKATHSLKIDKKEIDNFIQNLPFTLTQSQTRSMDEILNDLKSDRPMNRLLEGDVGSGKTVVAAIGCFVSFLNGFQSIIMAPTQILAQQHFDTLKKLFANYKVRVSLITSLGIKKDPGVSDIFVGTHSLIHKIIDIENCAFVVIDEQHRFGVEQRAHLTNVIDKKSYAPHVLTMTATPIPRTIVLTVYGDLSLSTLDELPKGRKPIKTFIVPPHKRNSAYVWINKIIQKDKSQAFIICPLIEESESEMLIEVKAVTSEYKKLVKIFPKLKLGLLHGRLKSKEKEKVVELFRNNQVNMLVSTPVVEVGIDVPNASIMVIEASERFGLAQLHQLRGRVGRGAKESFCLLFTDSKSDFVRQRLNAMQKNLSGFELAELDLKMRGPGEIFGTLQHGYHELKIASWQDTELIKKTKAIAEKAIKNKIKYKKLFMKLLDTDIALN